MAEELHGRGSIPILGLDVDLDNAEQVAEALYIVRDAKRQMDEAEAVLEHALIEEASRQGTSTLHLGHHVTVEVGGGRVTVR